MPTHKALTNAFIALFLAAGLLAPLRYYLGHDPYDERFSWRMFSAVRMIECKVAIEDNVGGHWSRVPLRSTIHESWQTALERNRMAVVEKYLAHRCETEKAEEVRMLSSCVATDGSSLPVTTHSMACNTRTLTVEGAP